MDITEPSPKARPKPRAAARCAFPPAPSLRRRKPSIRSRTASAALPAYTLFLRHVRGVDLDQVDVSHDACDRASCCGTRGAFAWTAFACSEIPASPRSTCTASRISY
jgi:hypothetical protein